MKLRFSSLVKPVYPWTLGLVIGTVFGVTAMAGIVWWSEPQPELEEVSRVFAALASLRPSGVASVGGDVTLAAPVVVAEPPALPMIQSVPTPLPSFTAESVIVKDVASGAVLFRKNEYARRPIASVTKLMSALVLLDQPLAWDKKIAAGSNALGDKQLMPGTLYTVEELWQAALVGSSNQAIVSLVAGEYPDPAVFRARMNEKARDLGMLDAVFVEPSGLDAGNVASASDVAILLDEALKHDEIADTVNMTSYTLTAHKRKEKVWNTNWLLLRWTPHTFTALHGGKTGYIPQSGYNFATQVEKDGYALTVVVLGADSNEARFAEARDIAEWVYENYEWLE